MKILLMILLFLVVVVSSEAKEYTVEKSEAIFHTDRVCSQQLVQQNQSVVGGVVGGAVGGGLGALAGRALFGRGFGSLAGGLVGTGVGASVGAGGGDTTVEVCEDVRVIKGYKNYYDNYKKVKLSNNPLMFVEE